MRTIAEATRDVVFRNPFLAEALSAGVVNLSALSRKIKPQVEEIVMNRIQLGAIVVALKRLLGQLDKDGAKFWIEGLGDLTVRSGLVEWTFSNSDSLMNCQARFFRQMKDRGFFCSLSQGVLETTLVAPASLEKEITRIFRKERLLAKFTHLASISIQLPKEIVDTPGVYYSILHSLAWEGLNVVEVLSTYTELTVIFHQRDIDRAFSALKKLILKTE